MYSLYNNQNKKTELYQVIDSPKVRIDWVVEGDIKGCFDNISHQKLLKLRGVTKG